MRQTRNLAYITFADFLARGAYQMGKTPLLPIFAATLGASGAFLGFIVSVSTLTGMLLKPFVGVFSDRWGRRGWLIVGTAFFAFVPFVYRFVQSPEQLFTVRIIHGIATAIYGPVTLAYVAEQSGVGRAERLGWFGMARTGGHIVGPAVGGVLLLHLDPIAIFTFVGLASSLVFIPVILLQERAGSRQTGRMSLWQQLTQSLREGVRAPAVWLAGSMDAIMYAVLYAARAFLPIYALSLDINIAVVGAFFAVQEATHLLLKPLGGRIGDRAGNRLAICAGMLLLGCVLLLIPLGSHSTGLLALSALIGLAQALVFPATLTLVSTQIRVGHIGAGMGLTGTLRNAGKVIGPIVGGALISILDYALMFQLLGGLIFIAGMAVGLAATHTRPSPPRGWVSGS